LYEIVEKEIYKRARLSSVCEIIIQLFVLHHTSYILRQLVRQSNSDKFKSLLKEVLCVVYFLAELLVDKAMELDHIGGTFGGNIKPTPFLCLLLKMLQIQPEKEIIVEFIKNDDYK